MNRTGTPDSEKRRLPLPKRWYQILIVLVTTFAGLLALAVASGAIDRLSHDGAADRSLAWRALGIYWVLSVLLLVVLGHLRTHWKQLLLLVGSTSAAVGVAEVSLRMLLPHLAYRKYQSGPSAQLHHVMPPKTTMHFGLVDEEHIFVETNADGLRTDYSRQEFKQAEVRIACLGDSFTFGWGVQGTDSYPAQLEQTLRKQLDNSSVAVLNAGVISYGPLLEDRLFRQVVRHYDPQIVLLLIDCTDIGDDHHYSAELDRSVSPEGTFVPDRPSSQGPHLGAMWRLTERWRDTDALKVPVRLLGRLFHRQPVYSYYSFEINIGDTVERNRFFIFRHPLSATRPYFDYSWSCLERLAAACEQVDAQLVVLVSPRFHHWNRKECPRNWEEADYLRDGPYQYEIFRYFEEQAATADFEVRSLLPAFQACRQFPLVFESDPHWNADGHQFAAKTVAKLLVDDLKMLGKSANEK